MSYDAALCDPITHKVLELEHEHFMQGGTYCASGTKELWLNITYNYGPIYKNTAALGEDGIYKLNRLSGAESISILKCAVAELKDDVASDYWMPTEGNAKRALLQLLAMAYMRPDGIWSIQ